MSGASNGQPGFLARFARQRFGMVALAWLLILVIASVFAPWIAPADPNATSFSETLLGPSADHLLGTDELGRDVLSRLLFASRVALLAGLEAITIGLVLGVPLGLVVGYVGGRLDRFAMRVIDALMAVPGLIVAFSIIAVLGPGLVNAMVAVGLLFAIRMARLVRGVVLSIREELYVDAARVGGVPRAWLLARTILPNAAGPIIVQTALYFGAALLIEATLSFLGLGVQVPQATWGTMLAESRTNQANQPFLPFPPGITLTLTVLAFNLLADAVRDVLGRDSQLGSRRPAPRPAAEHSTAPPSNALLSVRDLSVEVRHPAGALPALRSVDLDINRGEIVGLVGESGSGKSLTALSVMGLLAPGLSVASGSVHLDGRDLLQLRDRQMCDVRGKRIGMIFQEPVASLNPALPIGSQIAETLEMHDEMSHAAAHRRAIELLGMVGVPDPETRARDYPHQFSGGMAQRAMIASAIACGPDLLLADEPTTALDVTTQQQVLALIARLVDELDLGVLLITHDMGVVAEVCDRASVMYAGQVVESAPVEELFARPQHPYTAALLHSMPRNGTRGEPIPTIGGRVPNLDELPIGCAFAPRCDFATDACRTAPPTIVPVADDRTVRCIRHDQIDLREVHV